MHDRNPHRLEVIGHHRLVVVDVFERSLGWRGVVADVGVVGVERTIRRQPRHGARRLNAANTAQFFEQPLIQLRAWRRLRVIGGGQRHLERHQARSIESRINGREVVDRLDHQARTNHEHHGQRDFGDDEAAADVVPRPAGGAARATFLERERQTLDPGMHQRRETKDQTGDDRHAEREGQDRRIDGHFGGARQAARINAQQSVDTNAREKQSEETADNREQHPLGHELPQQPAAPGTQRGPHRELAMARLRAREQQVGEIRARDQQHESNRGLQHPDRAAGAADDLLLHGIHLQDVAEVGLPLFRRFRQRRKDVILLAGTLSPVLNQRGELGLRGLRRDAVLQSPDEIQKVVAAILAIGGIETDRHPDLGAVVHHVGARRHDADHFASQPVDLHHLSDDVALAAKGGLPEFVREDADRRQRNGPRGVRRRHEIGFTLRKESARQRLHTERRQQAIVDRCGADAQGTIAGAQVHLAGRVSADGGKRLVEVAEFKIFRRRHPELIEPKRRELGGEVHQLLRLRIAQRAQDHAVDDRENRGICADSQRERENRDCGERRRAQQASDSETEILAKVIEAHGEL